MYTYTVCIYISAYIHLSSVSSHIRKYYAYYPPSNCMVHSSSCETFSNVSATFVFSHLIQHHMICVYIMSMTCVYIISIICVYNVATAPHSPPPHFLGHPEKICVYIMYMICVYVSIYYGHIRGDSVSFSFSRVLRHHVRLSCSSTSFPRFTPP